MMFPDDLYRNQRTVSAHSSIVSRRAFLTLAASGLAVAERLSTYLTAAPIASAGHNQPITTDVDWLEEVQRRPENLPAGVPRLRPLLIQPDGAPIKTLKAWQAERARLRKSWLDFLGPMPDERPPIKLQMLGEDRPDGCIRQLVRYESEPGLPVEGYLLRPHLRRDRRPGVVALHGTSKDNIQEIAGVIGPPQRHLGLKLAQRGFVVVCPRCFLWQNAAT